MGLRTRQARTFDAVTVRALPEGGFVVSASDHNGRADVAGFGDIEGVIAWLDATAEPGEGFQVHL